MSNRSLYLLMALAIAIMFAVVLVAGRYMQ